MEYQSKRTNNLATGFAMLICLIINGSILKAQNVDSKVKWGHWDKWGDQKDGTYNNPILPGDFSDIDCIRVGKTFYAVSSTFQYSPGFIVLKSNDMVNWEIIGHVVQDITKIAPEMNWDKMDRYGRGIWAGAIRYHNKKFWIYFGDPDEGYFMSWAKNPGGPWSPVKKILSAKGWDDCCPFWDDDGQGYLVGTNFSDNYKIHLFKMAEDGASIIENSDKVIYQSKGSEANKLYKINGWYYHLFSEVKKDGRVLMMQRSKAIYGPYEGPKQLCQVQREFNEPNQGGLIQVNDENWYFLTHHGTGSWEGRAVSLLPVSWIDGWPVIGEPDVNGLGKMVWSGKMPLKRNPSKYLHTNDEFSKPLLGAQWEWNYQQRERTWSLSARKGWLRINAGKPLNDNFFTSSGTLTQRSYRTSSNVVVTKIDISKMQNGQQAGLAHFGYPDLAAVNITCEHNLKKISYYTGSEYIDQKILQGDVLWLKSTWDQHGINKYYFSYNGIDYQKIGNEYQLKWGAYRGDRIALYTFNLLAEAGSIDIDYFHYDYSR